MGLEATQSAGLGFYLPVWCSGCLVIDPKCSTRVCHIEELDIGSMYGWVKTLCLTKFCRKTEKEKNHVSAKKKGN